MTSNGWDRPVASTPSPARDEFEGWHFKGELVESPVRFISIVSLALAAGLLLGLVLFLRGL